jgi:hypothetical protein
MRQQSRRSGCHCVKDGIMIEKGGLLACVELDGRGQGWLKTRPLGKFHSGDSTHTFMVGRRLRKTRGGIV